VYAGVTETHTGAVLFVGDLAYKVKKPIDAGFLDWRDRAARVAACEREVELNRRLAPDVYLGVGELRAPGREPEPAVVMRRLPDDRRLSTLVRAGDDVERPLRRLAHQLAAFHLAAPTTPLAAEEASAEATLRRWEMNHGRLRAGALDPWVDDAVAVEVVERARRYLWGRRPLFEDRVRHGWARDGHGDLLADDIFCLDDGPRALDCLDFDDRLRVGDVLADVAFLAMDLEHLGRPDLATLLLDLHRELTGDTWPSSLGHHHVAYRAQVRALVHAIQAAQGGPHAADAAVQSRSLLALAAHHLRAATVRLVLVGGAPGTGKSTLAGGLGAALGAVVLRSDEVRKSLAGLPSGASAAADAGTGLYTPEWTQRTYDALVEHAAHLVERGESVVLDATWLDPTWRDRARSVAAASGTDVVELRCVAPLELAERRAAGRAVTGSDASDADAAIAHLLATAAGPWPEATEVDTSGDVGSSLAAALRAVR
jgi:hypothetical protein